MAFFIILHSSCRDAIFVVPYVSIVQEKVRSLSPFALSLNFHVEEYAGQKGCIPPKQRRKKQSIYIATIEKANAIVNSLVESQSLSKLGELIFE